MQIRNGADKCCIRLMLWLTEEYLIEDKFKFLTQGNVSVASLDDVNLYHQLLQSFDIIGISKEEQAGEFEICPFLIGWHFTAHNLIV